MTLPIGTRVQIGEGGIGYAMNGERVSIAAGNYTVLGVGDEQWCGYYKVSIRTKHTRRFWVLTDDVKVRE